MYMNPHVQNSLQGCCYLLIFIHAKLLLRMLSLSTAGIDISYIWFVASGPNPKRIEQTCGFLLNYKNIVHTHEIL